MSALKSELELENEVLRWLNDQPNYFAFKFPRGQKSFSRKNTVKHSGDGVADIICNISINHFVFVVYLECKTIKGSLRASQKEFRDMIRSVGGYYSVIRSLEDVRNYLEHVEKDIIEGLKTGTKIPF